MKDIQIDSDGNLRCASCGAKHFTEKRTVRAKVVGGGAAVATFGVAGAAAPLATRKKLQCKSCGTYNKQGNAQPFAPTNKFAAAGVPAPRSTTPKKEMSAGEAQLGLVMLTVFAIVGFVFAISAGSIVWSIVAGLAVLFFGIAAFAPDPANQKPRKSEPKATSPSKPVPRADNTSFQLKKQPPNRR